MPTTTKMRWRPVKRFDGGHKVFEEIGTGRPAIADDSGCTPDRTEDGALFIDQTRPMSVLGDQVVVPLLDANGERRNAFMAFEEACWLAVNYRMRLQTKLGMYQLTLAMN